MPWVHFTTSSRHLTLDRSHSIIQLWSRRVLSVAEASDTWNVEAKMSWGGVQWKSIVCVRSSRVGCVCCELQDRGKGQGLEIRYPAFVKAIDKLATKHPLQVCLAMACAWHDTAGSDAALGAFRSTLAAL